jgi:repressor LexA
MEDLTKRQREVLDFICEFAEENGYPPTHEEIQFEAGLSSKSHVHFYLKALERAGYIERAPNIPRGIRLTRKFIRGRFAGTIKVPFCGQIAAGEPVSFSDIGHETIELTRDIVRVRDGEGLYALRVKGDSMIDALINDGDIVVMRHQQVAGNGEMVAVRLKDRDETTLKRFYREKDRVRLQPANPTMSPLYVHPASVEIQGKVVAVIRQMS